MMKCAQFFSPMGVGIKSRIYMYITHKALLVKWALWYPVGQKYKQTKANT